MPTYEYECLTCGTHFEKRQSFHDAPQADCPNGHQDTRRLLATPTIVFKGSGFYVTDNRGRKNDANGTTAKKAKEDKPAKSKKKVAAQ